MTAQPEARFDGDALAAVAGYGIPGSLTCVPTAAMSADAWSTFLADVRAHNVIGLLGAAASDEAIPMTQSQADDVRSLMVETAKHTQQADEAVVTTVDTLASAGIDSRVLDGAAVARLDYDNPHLRAFAGAEVLVRQERLARAVSVLVAQGYRPRPSAAVARPAQREPTRLRATNGSDVTLLDRPRWLTGDADDLWQRFETFEVHGQVLRTLAREERFLDVVGRAAAADHGLGSKRDVAQAALHGRLDARRVLVLADSLCALPVVAATVCSTWLDLQLADVVALSTWARTWHDDGRSDGHSRRGMARPLEFLARAFDFLPGGTR